MAIDIFDFWSQIGRAEKIHPADRAVFDRVQHGFDHTSLPGCFMGPLRTAPVVLLFLSPGKSDGDTVTEALLDWHVRTRLGNAPLVSREEHAPAFEWWVSRTKCFGSADELRDKVAVMNIGAYHSEAFNDRAMLSALPSSRASLDWAQGVLFPEAIAGKRVVICLRSAEHWGLKRGGKYGESLFAPEVTRGGHMTNGPMRDEIIVAVKKALKFN
ncbi:MAG: hypothetical protein WCA78_08975 [Rhizomicrobium sp.]